MKKQSLVAALIVVLTLLSACAHREVKDTRLSSSPLLQAILKKGELVVGTSGDQPPLSMTTTEGEIIGMDVDIARSMADAMGVKLRLAPMPFAELLPALEIRKVDVIISGMTITAERNMKVAFVGPYFTTGKGMLAKRRTIASIRDRSEIDTPDMTLAALDGSTSLVFVQKNIPKAKIVATKNYDEAVEMVIQGKVDGFVADYPITLISAFRYPDEGLISLMIPASFEPLGIALPPNDPLMANWVENFLRALEGSGELDKLKNRWFKSGTWLKKLP